MLKQVDTNARPSMRARGRLVTAMLALASAAACGGGGDATTDTASSAAQSPPATSGSPASAAPSGPFTEADITPQLVALGDSIFKGRTAGGICFTCHSAEAEGGPIGPDLTDQEWLNGDASLGFIAEVVRNGVSQPKQYPAPMPAFGAQFTEEQVRAVSAYVYSRSHPGVGGG